MSISHEYIPVPERTLALPPAAILGSEVSPQPEHGQLHAELQQVRATAKFEKGVRDAKNAVSVGSNYDAIAKLVEPDSWSRGLGIALVGDLGAEDASGRTMLSALGETVGVTDLAQQTRSLRPDDEIHIDSGQGYVLEGRSSRKGQATWRITVDKDADPETREAAFDSFAQNLQIATEKYTGTRKELKENLST